MASTESLIVEQIDGLLVLRLNRPDRLNTITLEMVRRFDDVVMKAVQDTSVRAILLTGTGRAFCAGGDISSMGGQADAASTLDGMRAYHGWLMALRLSDKLLVTAINGVAAGGGFGLAMLGDLVVAAETASFKSAFCSLGASADYALGFTLPRAVGSVRAADILMSDRRISAREALDIGMVSHLLPAEDFAEQALALAQSIASLPRSAQLTKRLLRREEAAQLSEYLEMEAQCQMEAFQSEDFREGVSAFVARRAPNFVGR